MFKINSWTSQQKIKLYFKSNLFRSKLSTIKATILAILIGLVVGIFVMFLNGKNGFSFVQSVFQNAFTSHSSSTTDPNYSRTLNYFIVYSFLGIGLALGFKVGLFNMGGSGQAFLGFGLSMLMLMHLTGIKNGEINSNISVSMIFSIFLIFIISGVFISIITGVLKVFLNIHEVATSILLNWSIWYLLKWLLQSNFTSGSQITTPTIPVGLLSIGGQSWLIGLIALIVFVAGLAFLLKYTTFGFKTNIVGKQITAAKYAGINDKFYIIMITALQGLFIGVGSMFYYVSIVRGQNISNDIMPTIGFDAIAVALVASNNIFGILPVAFIWGIFKVGAESTVRQPDMLPMSKYITDVIFSIIIYSSTISILLIKFTPVWWIKIKWYLHSNKQLSKIIKGLKTQIKLNKKNRVDIHKSDEYIKMKKSIADKKSKLKLKTSSTINSQPQLNKQENLLLKNEIKLLKIAQSELVRSGKLKFKRNQTDLKLEIKALIKIEYEKYLESKKSPPIELAKKEYQEKHTSNLNKIIVMKNDIITKNNIIKTIAKCKKLLNSQKHLSLLKQDSEDSFANYEIKVLKENSNNSYDIFNKKLTENIIDEQNFENYINKRNLLLDNLLIHEKEQKQAFLNSAVLLIEQDNTLKQATLQTISKLTKSSKNRKEA